LQSSHWINKLKGRFVVFDGPDGCGKTTQLQRFTRFVHEQGVDVCHVREPGGTAIGEQIRNLLLDPVYIEMDGRCELLLHMASRAQLVAQQVIPALASGQLVLADRFISSTLAYQGAAGGIPISDIMKVGQIALGQCWPNLVVVFDVDEATAADRLSPLLDRIEQKGIQFHRTVRQGYLQQVHDDPDHYLLINAMADADTVFERLIQAMARRLNEPRP